MRVDFYQLSRDPAETAVALIARKSVQVGKKLLIVAEDDALLVKISDSLWGAPGTFLANGPMGGPHDARQPILLANEVNPANGASFLLLADGQWREAAGFERTFLFFDGATIEAARALWRELGSREGVERHFHRQEATGWIEIG